MATLNVAGTQATATNASGVKGITQQYQLAGKQSATIKGRDTGNILGTTPPGKPGIKLVDGTIQNSTDPLVIGQLATNQADNFLSNTTGSGLVPTMNAAQAASAGKSLAPEHE